MTNEQAKMLTDSMINHMVAHGQTGKSMVTPQHLESVYRATARGKISSLINEVRKI